jgi:hypothetical protein
MNKTFSKFNNKEENKVNSNSNSSFVKEGLNKTYYENRNNNLRSLSPITYKKNEHIESHRILEGTFDLRKSNNQDANISYFEEFNVIYLKIKNLNDIYLIKIIFY